MSIKHRTERFITENNEIMLDAIRQLDQVRERAGDPEEWLQRDLVDQPVGLKSPVRERVAEVWDAAADQHRALDQRARNYYTGQAEKGRKMVNAGKPTETEERLLIEQVRSRVKDELTPLFEQAGDGVAGAEIVKRFKAVKRAGDPIDTQAWSGAIRDLVARHNPRFLGLDADELTADPDPAAAKTREEGNALLATVEKAEGVYARATDRRETQKDLATRLLREQPGAPIAPTFEGGHTTNLDQMMEGVPDELQLADG